MQKTSYTIKSSRRSIYVGILSLTLFLMPIIIFKIVRNFLLQNQELSYQDLMMLSGYWFSAVLVWSRIKYTWLLTVSILSLVIFINAISLFTNIKSENSAAFLTQLLLSITALSVALILADYLNSKYFDRRDRFSIFGAADRHNVSYRASIISSSGHNLPGQVNSLSFSGAAIEMDAWPATFNLVGLKLKIPKLSFFTAQSMEIVEISEKKIRIRFTGRNFLFTARLYFYLRDLKKNDQ